MKIFTKNQIVQKMLIALLIVILITFAFPQRSHADFGNDLLKELVGLFANLGDVVMGVLNNFMVGTDSILDSVMLSQEDENLNQPSNTAEEDKSWLKKGLSSSQKIKIDLSKDLSDENGDYDADFKIPNMIYSPENIFANRIAALDVNFFESGTYYDVHGNQEDSAVADLKSTIATWYNSFRNIAVVGLLSVLIYLGIRIMISSTAPDKAKYKETLKDWLVAMCLVFVIHFIMAGILMVTEQVTKLLDPGEGAQMAIELTGGKKSENITFNTNLTGLIRFRAQDQNWGDATAYTLMYIVLIIYTCVFTVVYLKRLLYMAFLTMIAPLVALTYPLDRAGDGKAQAFNMWFKEYLMNALIQPVHLVIYTALVSTAANLVEKNLIYALVAIGFIIPAEKMIKAMFNLNKADSVSGLGAFAGGALAMQGLQKLGSLGSKKFGGSGNGSGGNSESSNEGAERINYQDRGTLESFNSQENNNQSPENRQNNNTEELDETGQQWMDYINGQEEENGRAAAQQQGQQSGQNNNTEELDETGQQWMDYINGQEEDNGRTAAQQQGQQSGQNNGNQRPQPRNKYGRRLVKKAAISGAKKLGKVAYKASKIAARGGLAFGGGLIGTAAAIATGDASNIIKGASIGIATGNALGKSVGNLADSGINTAKGIPGSIRDKVDSARYNINKEKYGEAYARQQMNEINNERAKKQFMKNKDEEEKYSQIAARIRQNTGREYTSKQLMEAAFDYKKAGITDEKNIEKGLELESKHEGVGGVNHDKMIDIIDMTQTYGKDYILDEKKREQTEKLVKSAVRGKQNQESAMELFAEAHGLKDFYKNQRNRR